MRRPDVVRARCSGPVQSLSVGQIDDIRAELGALDRTLASIEAVLDLPSKRVTIADLEEQSAAPDRWSDQEHAQKVTSRLSRLKAEVERMMSIRVRLSRAGCGSMLR